MKFLTPPVRILIGLLVGLIVGLSGKSVFPAIAGDASAVAQILGKLWLAGLQMTIVPLVVCMLIVGVQSARNAAASGRVARRAVTWFLVLLVAAATYSALLAPLFLSLFTPSAELVAALKASSAPIVGTSGIVEWLKQLVPSNAIQAAAQGAIVPLVVFALCVAFALNRVEPTRAKLLVDFCQAIADTMIVIVHGVLWLAPLGVACLILPVAVDAGTSVLGALGVYILMLCCLYGGIVLLLYPLVRFGGESISRFGAAVLPAQVVAASTQSSLASLPAMLEASTQPLAYPRSVAGLVLPMAVSLFRITSPVQYLAVVAFLGWSFGIDIAIAPMVMAVILSVAISVGSVGLPGQAIFMGTNLPVVQSVGLPVEPLGLLLAIDLVPDMVATVGNVTGDLAVTSRVARAEPNDGSA